MSKVIVELGYKSYVMEADKALALMELLQGAERYQSKYHGGGRGNTHHVYDEEFDMSIKYMPDKLYGMAKLAGKPEEK